MTYRERFETAWMKEHPLHGATAFKRSGLNPDAYVNTRVQDGWLMWQAAEAAAIERCAKWLSSTGNMKAANGLLRALLQKEK